MVQREHPGQGGGEEVKGERKLCGDEFHQARIFEDSNDVLAFVDELRLDRQVDPKLEIPSIAIMIERN